MKLPQVTSPRGRHGFTLVELLVVITLIAVLAGVSVPVYNSIMKNMRVTQTRVLAVSLQNSVKGYYTEYQKYPVPSTGGSETEAIRTDSMLIPALMGKDPITNPRQIPFLPELKDATETGKYGLIMEGGGATSARVVDSWGEEYFVIMDLDYNNEVENPDVDSASSTLYQTILVYSGGEDREPENWDDNVMSWTNTRKDKNAPKSKGGG
jgi:prepilin-type N-terminal cleavage/methylation domain-containing protein